MPIATLATYYGLSVRIVNGLEVHSSFTLPLHASRAAFFLRSTNVLARPRVADAIPAPVRLTRSAASGFFFFCCPITYTLYPIGVECQAEKGLSSFPVIEFSRGSDPEKTGLYFRHDPILVLVSYGRRDFVQRRIPGD